jgi:hypothetical protein
MATNTLIQKLPALGETLTSVSQSHRRQVETFLASDDDIAAGDWVMFDVTKTGPERVIYVDRAANTALGNNAVVGVALEAATVVGQRIKVVVSGYAEGAAVETAVTVGQPLIVSATGGGAVGRAMLRVVADLGNACGVALEGAAANKCDVWVYKNF